MGPDKSVHSPEYGIIYIQEVTSSKKDSVEPRCVH